MLLILPILRKREAVRCRFETGNRLHLDETGSFKTRNLFVALHQIVKGCDALSVILAWASA
jgi:hypothetical protein